MRRREARIAEARGVDQPARGVDIIAIFAFAEPAIAAMLSSKIVGAFRGEGARLPLEFDGRAISFARLRAKVRCGVGVGRIGGRWGQEKRDNKEYY